MDASTGYITQSATVTDANGDLERKSITTDPSGKVVEEISESTKTDEVAGTITTTSVIKDENGTLSSSNTQDALGNYSGYSQELDANGKVVEQTDYSKNVDPASGDYEMKSQTVDGTGKVIESINESQKTDASGNVTQKSEVTNRDGSYEKKEVTKDKTGGVNSVQTDVIVGNEKTSNTFEGDGTGKSVILLNSTVAPVVKANAKDAAEGSVCVVPAVVTGFGNEAWPVVGIGKEAFTGNTYASIEIPDSIASIGEAAFEDNGATEIHLAGKVTKNMFGKNAFKGNGTKAKGKGLTFYVASKKDMKQLKKALKKTGVPKAKIKVAK